ncbi:MAG TPA: methyltransferase domain-containing protein [Candidatus Tectomicrobia bacterium]|nr:methyltransferase domain-containing protein [Candidatus Tectomicrobia bacterium]
MFKHHWPELYTGPWIVGGNVAKVKVVHELQHLISAGFANSILDIGIVGLRPLEFWEPILETYASQFHLTGVDVRGIDRARQVVEQRNWEKQVILHQGSGYTLHKLFAPESFDVVVATQVLEHIAQLPRFIQQAATVMRSGGQGFLTVDSAHYQSRFDIKAPVRLAKNLAKKGLSLLGYEKHFDLPLMDHEIISTCKNAGLKTQTCRYYNLYPIKFIHNHVVPDDRKNTFLKLWFDLEEFLNDIDTISLRIRHLFMGLYIHVVKP